MRRLDLHPKKKFRGKRRRWRQFNARLSRIAQYRSTPEDVGGWGYFNWKIPAYQKAFAGVRTTANRWLHSWVIHGLEWLRNQDPQYVSCILIATPELFASEYCTFFSHDHFQSFIHRRNESETRSCVKVPCLPGALKALDLSPFSLIEVDVLDLGDDEDGPYRAKWYLICNDVPNQALEQTRDSVLRHG